MNLKFLHKNQRKLFLYRSENMYNIIQVLMNMAYRAVTMHTGPLEVLTFKDNI